MYSDEAEEADDEKQLSEEQAHALKKELVGLKGDSNRRKRATCSRTQHASIVITFLPLDHHRPVDRERINQGLQEAL